MVTYKESQTAFPLIHDNFPKSLLWQFNAPHMKQSKQVYIQHSTSRLRTRKSVKFSSYSQELCLGNMFNIEIDYLTKYGSFSDYIEFLKSHKIFNLSDIKTKVCYGQRSLINVFFTLQSDPVTSPQEISLLYK